MSKSKTSKMRGYAAKLGRKVPYKVQYDSKKCSQVRQYQGEQTKK